MNQKAGILVLIHHHFLMIIVHGSLEHLLFSKVHFFYQFVKSTNHQSVNSLTIFVFSYYLLFQDSWYHHFHFCVFLSGSWILKQMRPCKEGIPVSYKTMIQCILNEKYAQLSSLSVFLWFLCFEVRQTQIQFSMYQNLNNLNF